MQIKNRKDVKPVDDATCGILQEMYDSENLSISYSTISNRAKSHKHLNMEEVYYIVKGKGKIKIGDKILDIKEGDVIPIPKGVYHNVDSVDEPIELIAVTYPRFDKKDIIY